MTPEQAIEQLKTAQRDGDTEGSHIFADQILCELLIALGHKAVVDEWEKIGKWYA